VDSSDKKGGHFVEKGQKVDKSGQLAIKNGQ